MTSKKNKKVFELQIAIAKGQLDLRINVKLIKAILLCLIIFITFILILLSLSNPTLWANVLKQFLYLANFILGAVYENTKTSISKKDD